MVVFIKDGIPQEKFPTAFIFLISGFFKQSINRG